MPEHIHMLVGEPATGTPSTVMQVLKQRVSKRSNRIDSSGQQLKQFWEHRFYDFNVWNREKIAEKLQYMHLNPVARGLVSHPEEWVWSSFSFYSEGEGLIRVDPVG
jgi:putative transposase